MSKEKEHKSTRPFKCLVDNRNLEINQMIEDTYAVINKGRRFFYNLGQNLAAIQLFEEKNELETFAKQFAVWFTLEDRCEYNSPFIIDYTKILDKFNQIAKQEGFGFSDDVQFYLSSIIKPPQKNKVWVCRYDAGFQFRKEINLEYRLLERLYLYTTASNGSRGFFSFFQNGEKADWNGKFKFINSLLSHNLQEYPYFMLEGYEKFHKGSPDAIVLAMRDKSKIKRDTLEKLLVRCEINAFAHSTPKEVKDRFYNWLVKSIDIPYNITTYTVMFSIASENRKSSHSNYVNSIKSIIKETQELNHKKSKLPTNYYCLENFEIKSYFRKWFISRDKKPSIYKKYLKDNNKDIDKTIANLIEEKDHFYSNIQDFMRLVHMNNMSDADAVKCIDYFSDKADLERRKLTSFGNESDRGINYSADGNFLKLKYMDDNTPLSIGNRNAHYMTVNLPLYNKKINDFENKDVIAYNKRLFDANVRDILFERRFDGMTQEQKEKFQVRKGGRLDIVDGKYYLTINHEVYNDRIKNQFDFEDISLVVSCDLGQKKAAAVSAMLWSTNYFEGSTLRSLSIFESTYQFYVKEVDNDFVKVPSYFHNQIQSEDLLSEKGYLLSDSELEELNDILRLTSAESLNEEYSAKASFEVSYKVKKFVCNKKTNKYADIIAKHRSISRLYNLFFKKNANSFRKSIGGLSYERIKCLENISSSFASIVAQSIQLNDDRLSDIIKECSKKHNLVLNKKRDVVAEKSRLIANAIVSFAVDVKCKLQLPAGTKFFLAAEKIEMDNTKNSNASKTSRKNNAYWDVKRLSKHLTYACENYGIDYHNVPPNYSSHINHKTMKSCEYKKDKNPLLARVNEYNVSDLDISKFRNRYKDEWRDNYKEEWNRLFNFFGYKDFNEFAKNIKKSGIKKIYVPETYGDYIRIKQNEYSLSPEDYMNADLNAAKVIGYRFLGIYFNGLNKNKNRKQSA